MRLSIGFSPCPNDTFIFDALVNKKINTGTLDFDPVLADVETLNKWALEGRLDITKLSFPAFFRSEDQYVLLSSGSALGKGVGPVLVSKKKLPAPDTSEKTKEKINNALVALPGLNTTAHLLFSFAYPEARKKEFMIFSAIEEAILNEKADMGVIIHENRFTYQQKGLHKVMDLGEYWEQEMKCPIPLGGIAINQRIKRSVALEIDSLIRQSLAYAFDQYPQIPDYVKQNSQSMTENVMRQHIDLYVNNYSLDLGEEGRNAIQTLFYTYAGIQQLNEISLSPDNFFLL